MAHLLILGGTAEANALAEAAAEAYGPGLAITVSLAGLTRTPVLPGAGTVRRGGFGGAEGLAAHIRGEGVDFVIDATHPFAARITANAAEACAATGAPLLRLDRPPWTPQPGDDWRIVPDMAAAAALLPALGSTAFLTVGAGDLAPFATIRGVDLILRLVDPPRELPIEPAALILARGPFTVEGERTLLDTYGIDVLVAKNSGGAATAAKLTAARQAGISVVMVDRPRRPAGPVAETVDQALDWLGRRLAERGAG